MTDIESSETLQSLVNSCDYKSRLLLVRKNPKLINFYSGRITRTMLENAFYTDRDILFKIDHTRVSIKVLKSLTRRRKTIELSHELRLKLQDPELYDILFC